jgi:imidazolonepropionase-like amidohydrolase
MIARAFPSDQGFGEIAPGLRADLVLTQANPLEGLQTLRRPLGVMASGRWYGRDQLDGLLAGVAGDYDQASAHR